MSASVVSRPREKRSVFLARHASSDFGNIAATTCERLSSPSRQGPFVGTAIPLVVGAGGEGFVEITACGRRLVPSSIEGSRTMDDKPRDFLEKRLRKFIPQISHSLRFSLTLTCHHVIGSSKSRRKCDVLCARAETLFLLPSHNYGREVHVFSPVERANAVGPVQLIGTERKKVYAERVYEGRQIERCLSSIRVKNHLIVLLFVHAYSLRNFRKRLYRSYFVVGPSAGYEHRFRTQFFCHGER